MKTAFIAIFLFTHLQWLASGADQISTCPDIGGYRIGPYLNTAMSLQKAGKEVAIVELKKWGKTGQHDDQIILLCRMLFVKKAGEEFRQPGLGGPMFFGGTTNKDWPFEPITLQEGVPILITRGYTVAGMPEPGSRYLEYCLAHCDWNPFLYSSKSEKNVSEIVSRFVSAYPWRHPLSKADISFFISQSKL